MIEWPVLLAGIVVEQFRRAVAAAAGAELATVPAPGRNGPNYALPVVSVRLEDNLRGVAETLAASGH